ncbi:MAG: hypothetical protein O7C75_05470 [Verrucomicrobia bacterium]|nr:hypothetical protein [Verrucomicrobiota bacterium]
MELPDLFLYVASWLSVTGGIWGLFGKAEDVISAPVKSAISQWLRDMPFREVLTGWPSSFAGVFDQLFGEHHLSIKCFLQSCVASVLSVATLTLIWGTVRPEQLRDLFQIVSKSPYDIGLLFLLVASLNLIPDYISLLETRWILRWLATSNSVPRTLALLVVDLVVTGMVFGTAYVLLGWYMGGSKDEMVYMLVNGAFLTKGQFAPISMGVFLYSTYFTSVWIWIYILSGLVTRFVGMTVSGFGRLFSILNIEEKPLRSLGFVAILIVSAIYALIPLL